MRLMFAALAVVLTAGPVAAQMPAGVDRATLRIAEAIELPGMTLPPGDYEFKLLETPEDRSIVQVQERRTGRILTTLLSVPAERSRASDEAVVPFSSSRPDIPRPIRYWFLPGQVRGYELVYPREQAVAIAAITGARVLTAETTSAVSMRTARVSAVDGEGRRVATAESPRGLDVPRVALNTTPDLPPRTTAALVREPAAMLRETPPSQAAQAPPPPAAPALPEQLPETAGSTLLVLLVGAICLVAALAFRFRRRPV